MMDEMKGINTEEVHRSNPNSCDFFFENLDPYFIFQKKEAIPSSWLVIMSQVNLNNLNFINVLTRHRILIASLR